MTAEMLQRARANIATYRTNSGLDNVEFRMGEIEHLPVADNSVDVIMSNCVINLSEDKPQVWKEIGRVLKPGGRVAASDMALLRELPDIVRNDANNWTGCVGGAILISAYQAMIESAGLTVEVMEPREEYVRTLVESGDAFYQRVADQLQADPADYITSIAITATKEA